MGTAKQTIRKNARKVIVAGIAAITGMSMLIPSASAQTAQLGTGQPPGANQAIAAQATSHPSAQPTTPPAPSEKLEPQTPKLDAAPSQVAAIPSPVGARTQTTQPSQSQAPHKQSADGAKATSSIPGHQTGNSNSQADSPNTQANTQRTAPSNQSDPAQSAPATPSTQPNCEIGKSTIAQCFPDKAFANVIIQAVSWHPLPASTFTQAMADGITSLVPRTHNAVSSLEGAQYLTNLTEITLDSGTVSDLTPLSGLTKLNSIILSNNRISDLKPLKNLTNLTTLTLSDNRITDLSGIENLTSLNILLLEGSSRSYYDTPTNQIQDLTPLRKLTKLTRLNISDNAISDLNGIQNLTSLNTLFASGSSSRITNNIRSLTPLKRLTSLNELELENNNISDITPLASLDRLLILDLSNNPINNNIKPLSEIHGLGYLKLNSTGTVTLDGLKDLAPHLRQLEISGNEISDLKPLSEFSMLTDLNASGNEISDLKPLAGLKSIINLRLDENRISDIEGLAGLSTLTQLDLQSNAIKTIGTKLDGLTSLQTLMLSQNDIRAITTKPNGLTSLNRLILDHNRISDISGLSALTSLQTLYMQYNVITDTTPLTNLTELNDVNLTYNKIDNLAGLSNLHKLEHRQKSWRNVDIDLSHNNISDLTPLSSLTGLTSLNLSNNNISDLKPLESLTKLGSTAFNDGFDDIGSSALKLDSNHITDFSPLAKLVNLPCVDLEDNQISDLTPIKSMPFIIGLDLQGNDISDLTPLVGHPGIASGMTDPTTSSIQRGMLNLNKNHISDLTPLVGFVDNLQVLKLMWQTIELPTQQSPASTTLDGVKLSDGSFAKVTSTNPTKGATYDQNTGRATFNNLNGVKRVSLQFKDTQVYGIYNSWATYSGTVSRLLATQHTVTFNLGYEGTTPYSRKVFDGDRIYDESPSRNDGYVFDKWQIQQDGQWVDYDMSAPVTKDITLKATWIKIPDQPTYTCTILFNTGDAQVTVPAQEIKCGGQAVSPIPPSYPGYTFGGWQTKNNGRLQGINLRTAHFQQDTTLFAKWIRAFHTVRFDTGEGGTPIASKNVAEGDTIGNVENPTRPGYTFVCWQVERDGVLTDYNMGAGVSDDITLVAKWQPLTHTVTFIIDAEAGKSETVKVKDQGLVTRPGDPTRKHWNFTGWKYYNDTHDLVVYDFSTPVTEDITIYAQWERIMRTVSFDTGEGGSHVNPIQVADGDSFIAPPNPTLQHYDFISWQLKDANGKLSDYDFSTEVLSDFTLYAKWKHITHTVSFDTGDGATKFNPITVGDGDTIGEINKPTRPGYRFHGWQIRHGSNLVDYDTLTTPVTGDITLIADWMPINYKVTFDASPVSITETSVPENGTLTDRAPKVTRIGYTLSGWKLDKDGHGTLVDYDLATPVTHDIRLVAVWIPDVHTVTFDTGDGATTIPPKKVNYDDTIGTVTPPTRPGYTFLNWQIDNGQGKLVDYDTLTTPVTHDITLHAKWVKSEAPTPVTHKVTFDTNGGSAIDPVTVNDGDNLTGKVPTTTREGYTLKGWQIDDGHGNWIDYQLETAVTHDLTLRALWEPNKVPGNPDQPGKPDNPDNPDQPGKPDNPGNPNKPGNPDQPSNPGNPGTPGTPNNPGQPANPSNPDNSGTPSSPGESGNSGTPSKPGTGSNGSTSSNGNSGTSSGNGPVAIAQPSLAARPVLIGGASNGLGIGTNNGNANSTTNGSSNPSGTQNGNSGNATTSQKPSGSDTSTDTARKPRLRPKCIPDDVARRLEAKAKAKVGDKANWLEAQGDTQGESAGWKDSDYEGLPKCSAEQSAANPAKSTHSLSSLWWIILLTVIALAAVIGYLIKRHSDSTRDSEASHWEGK
ncbi:InlB B-repeat-containing protein [Bifidobacterium sp. ESL0769]|uniref:InlB B-repeat-containing protein n=1 Tax=Bifidobacterium sp. ESL0769 TaxID=2983229 RepID=UPI0023F8121E|nr:InlB B-repeat-containing protein [Bifidobacterium sp. ESL0769]WEV67296.1 InlB B-repeat-containing protein [Bifidobacterium sp. ESL0769]